MNILMVSSYLPAPTSGSRSRSYYLLKMLARQHSVSLLAISGDSKVKAPHDMVPLESFTQSVELLDYVVPTTSKKRLHQLIDVVKGVSSTIHHHQTSDMQSALERLCAHKDYDVVIFESALTSGSRLPQGVKVLIDQHNIEYELLQRACLNETDWLRKWYNQRESRLIEKIELDRCRQAQAIAVTSERERLLLQNALPQHLISVVPNGVDVDFFTGSEQQDEENRIVFTGSMEYYPNVQAVLYFAQHCWPLIRQQLPDATWQIVGKNPLPDVQKLAKLPGVTVTGTVGDVRPYFTRAKVAIVPLLIGGGTRLKILEAMAMRTSVVSTSLGCEGLSVVPGTHLLVEDEPEAFANAIIELCHDRAKRSALGAAGRALVEAEYSWQQCGDQLLHLLEHLKSSEATPLSAPRPL